MLNYENVFNPYSPSGKCVYSTDNLEKGVFKVYKDGVITCSNNSHIIESVSKTEELTTEINSLNK